MLHNQLQGQTSIAPPSSLHSALQIEPNQHLQIQQQQQQPDQQQPTPQNSRKRGRKADGSGEEASSPSEPRRLRRSHEACARCRSKKIKCDSKHPRCTACATAGTVCHQEDRHRQTLTPRGHTERIELKLAQCEALLKRHIPNFTLDNLDEILVREGIDIGSINPPPPTAAFQIEGSAIRPFRTDAPLPPPPQQQPMGPKGYAPMYPPPHMMHPYGPMLPYGPGPYPMPMQPPPGAYNPHIHPGFQPHAGPYPPPVMAMQQQQQPSPQPLPQQAQSQQQGPPPAQAQPPPAPAQRSPAQTSKGTDPNGNDLSNTESLAKNFGVSAAIIQGLSLGPDPVDKEDLTVGSSGLSSGRDRSIGEASAPRDVTKWVAITVRRLSNASANPPLALGGGSTSSNVEVWLPKDRKIVNFIVDVYFKRLNINRPVFVRSDFEKVLDDLYEGRTISHDPGYVCSVYLILALGTLSELNHLSVSADLDNKSDAHLGPSMAKKLMPRDWPEHDEFFERALGVKPDLRVTISSLQALILLHWYLYTERQGRTLWRLVGSLVRLAVELGLHHDPTIQVAQLSNTNNPPTPLFTEEECQLRIRLWAIVLIHDRGTSILLGRPLAIAPTDSNTPRPSRLRNRPSDFSEHFELSQPIAEIQADIINSLYTPKKQSKEIIMHHATRIIKNLLDFRKSLPAKYQYYFSGTDDWSLDKRSKLVQDITEDEGLTLLKIGIARILMLRALFSSKELDYEHRHKALVDAIITSHNTIIVHNQLIRFPDIAFFTSPIPLHIAAMVILYGVMSHCDILPRVTELEDVWLALDLIPRFRWRWERKDVNGGHPLIAKLAERVMNADLHSIQPSNQFVLQSERDWEEETTRSPITKSQQDTPVLSPATYTSNGSSAAYGPPARPVHTSSGRMNGSGSQKLVEVPSGLFYPFYPENQLSAAGNGNGIDGNGNSSSTPSSSHQDYSHLLAVAGSVNGSFGYQASQDTYMSEERLQSPHQHQHGMQMWMNPNQRSMPYNSNTSPS